MGRGIKFFETVGKYSGKFIDFTVSTGIAAYGIIGFGLYDIFWGNAKQSEQLKQKIRKFTTVNPGKWAAIKKGFEGDKDIAVKLLSFYFDYYIPGQGRHFDTIVEAMDKPYTIISDVPEKLRSWLNYLENISQQEGWKLQDRPWKEVRQNYLNSKEITKLHYEDGEFYLWLAKEFVDARKSGAHRWNLENPFGAEEMAKLM